MLNVFSNVICTEALLIHEREASFVYIYKNHLLATLAHY